MCNETPRHTENAEQNAAFRQVCELLRDGSPEHVKDALRKCTLLAMAGHPSACGVLGSCYEDGLNTEKDAEAAFFWYQRAADLGSPLGTLRLARCLKYGLGTEPNHRKSVELFQKAADLGVPEAPLFLGDAYQSGQGVDEDPQLAYNFREEAVRRCTQAVAEDSTSAMIALSACYEDELGMPPAKDDEERQSRENQAVLLLYQAAQLGDPRGWAQMAFLYLTLGGFNSATESLLDQLLLPTGIITPSSTAEKFMQLKNHAGTLRQTEAIFRATAFLRDL